jgi:hypothetical protein
MHDLVHELARSVLDDELIAIDAANNSSNTSEQKYYQYAVFMACLFQLIDYIIWIVDYYII